MRRDSYEMFKKGSYIGLLDDCVYYCRQREEITVEESLEMERLLDVFYEEEKLKKYLEPKTKQKIFNEIVTCINKAVEEETAKRIRNEILEKKISEN